MQPDITCIIPAWNEEALIADAIESVLAQSHPVDELIVVDDGSTDRTADIASSYAKVRLIRQANAGLAGARNAGLYAAQGNYIAFLDADDLWKPEKLALQVPVFAQDPAPDLCLCHVEHIDIRPVTEGRAELNLPKGPVPGGLMATLLAPKAVFERVGAFDTSLRASPDHDWFMRARAAGITEQIRPETLVTRRIHGTNMSLQFDQDKRRSAMALLERALRDRRAKGEQGQAVEEWRSPGK
ncbi:glycosyltransferase family 2 protein [Celeribacter baekdonensis]|uniref:glycosyltransferase family 2 protein n=1 Tax=Celeribacter baekdonensis TaxID=875171 RepID=UPI003A8E567D